MNVAEASGLLVIAVCVMILLLFSVPDNLYISVYHFSVLFLVFTIAILVMVYNLDPRQSIRWDLLVHYDTLKQMQEKGMEYVLHESEYKYLFLINIYFYLISLTGNFRLLPVFPVLLDFLCALYMIQDQMKVRYGWSVPLRSCTFIAGLWFMSFGFMLAVSGIRCVFAMAMGMTGLYLEYYKKKYRVMGILLYCAALMSHTLGVVIPLIRLFLWVKNKILLLTAMVAGCILLSPALTLLSKVIGASYLRYLLGNIAKYWSSRSMIRWFLHVYNSDRTVLLCYLCICIFNLYMLCKIYRSNRAELQTCIAPNEKTRAWNLISTIAVVYIIGMFNALFTQRLTYILAYSFPITVSLYLKSISPTWKNMVLHLFMLFIFFWLFFFNDLYIFIVNYTGVYFLDL